MPSINKSGHCQVTAAAVEAFVDVTEVEDEKELLDEEPVDEDPNAEPRDTN